MLEYSVAHKLVVAVDNMFPYLRFHNTQCPGEEIRWIFGGSDGVVVRRNGSDDARRTCESM